MTTFRFETEDPVLARKIANLVARHEQDPVPRMNTIKADVDATQIRLLRNKAGLTQGELSKLADIHEVTISHLETGKRKTKLKTYKKLEDACLHVIRQNASAK